MAGNSRPRILMLYDFPLHGGGSGAYVHYLSLRLTEAYGYTVGVALPEAARLEKPIAVFPFKLPQTPVFIGRPGLEKSPQYSQLTPRRITDLYQAFIKGTIAAVEAFRPDIIHVHHTMVVSWAARFARSIYGTKFIVTSHGSCLHAIARDRRYFRLTRDALYAANAVTVISGDTRAKLLRMFGPALSSKTRTIPGGIRLSLFPAERPRAEIRRRFRLPPLSKIALFTGRLISEKGAEYLVKASRKIAGQVVIAGDGPQREHLEELVRQLKLNNVTILPFARNYKDFIDLYYAADVFVSPAVWDEPLGLTIIEAMAAKTPVVVTRKGGVTMAVKDGVNGLFVRPRNSSEIAQAVNKLFSDERLREKMGERGRAVVEKRFTWTKIAERFDKLYRKVYFNR